MSHIRWGVKCLFQIIEIVRTYFMTEKTWFENHCYPYAVFASLKHRLKLDLHLNVNVNEACGSEARQNIWYICTLFGIAEAVNRPYIQTYRVRIPFEVLTVYR